MDFIWKAILYILPAYIANSMAVIFGGGTRIDFDKTLFNAPILGKGKTWKGLIIGTLIGTAVGFVISFLFPNFLGNNVNFTLLSFLLAFGSLFGDLCFAFVKRRLGMKRGAMFPIVDQLDFILGALVFSSFVYLPDFNTIVFLLIFTPLVHLTANFIAYQLKLKKEPY